MKKLFLTALAALFVAASALAQQPTQPQQHCGQHGNGQHCGRHQQGPKQQPKPTALKYNADGVETTLAAALPEAKSVKKTNRWTEVYNAKGKLIGYGVYSKPASDGIKGYAGETPVLIVFDKKQKITGVYLLPNVETPNFARRVEEAGFYKQWNGLTVKEAKKKQVDTVSGATFTSRAVVQSVQAALEKL